MKRLLFAGLAVLALAGSAAAADLYPAAPLLQGAGLAPPLYTWTGFYLGVNGGGGIGNSKWDTTNSFNISGGLFGATVGYNYQYGWAVIRRRRRYRLGGPQGFDRLRMPRGMQHQQLLAFDGARARRLRRRPLHALHHRWPRRRQLHGFHARAVEQHDKRRLDGWRRHRIRHHRPLERQGGISLCRSRQVQLRPELRRGNRQRGIHHQHHSWRRQLSLLNLGRAHELRNAPGQKSRGVLFGCSSIAGGVRGAARRQNELRASRPWPQMPAHARRSHRAR